MKIEQYTELEQSVENKILKLSILANVRNNGKFAWETFSNDIFHNFVNKLLKK